MPKIVITRGPGAGQECELGSVTTIGRSFEADVRVDDLTVSRRHAQIVKGPQGFLLQDLGSGNGTLLNGQRIGHAEPLQDGDEIGISNIHFVFKSTSAAKRPDRPRAESSTTLTIVDKGEDGSAILESVNLEDKDRISGILTRDTDFGQLVKMHRRLKTVIEIGNAIASTLDEQQQLEMIMDRLFDVFPQADRGFIVLVDPTTRRLRPTVVRPRGDAAVGQQVAISRTIVKEVMDKRKGILSSDAMGDDRFAGGASIVNLQIRSMMCVPLLAQDDLLGLIHIDTKRQGELFSADDLNLLAAIANQVALAVANSRLHKEVIAQERLKRDLEVANKVQQSFLPQGVPQIDGFEFKDAYRAALEVGGDFYDFIDLGNGEWGIVLGDVSGKGVSAALLMAKLMSDVRFYALAEGHPPDVLRRLNQQLAHSNAEDVFVTLLFMKLDVKSHRLVIASAGHLPPFMRRGQGGVVRIEDQINYPLGVLPDTEFKHIECKLQPGDALAVFTDGIIEAMNAKGEQYGFDRLEAALADDKATPAALVEHVLEDVRGFVGGTAQSDDLTLVCFGPL